MLMIGMQIVMAIGRLAAMRMWLGAVLFSNALSGANAGSQAKSKGLEAEVVGNVRGMMVRVKRTLVALYGDLRSRWSSLAFVEQLFVVLRLLAIPGVLIWLWFNPYRDQLFEGIISLLTFFTLYTVVVHIAVFTFPVDRLRRFQFLEVLCDFVFITLLLKETGTVGGIFQLGYLLLIVFASYYFRLRSALALVVATICLTVILALTSGGGIYWGDVALLAGVEVLVAVGVGVMARREHREREKIENLNRKLEVRSAELTQAYRSILASWASAVDAKDAYTRGHAERVSRLSAFIAEAMGLPAEECDRIAVAALLHDVGKIAVPDTILGKPSGLTSEEWLVIRQHPVAGAEMIERVEALRGLAPIVMSHHERADGSGYPHGVGLEDIPLGARIIAVADVYDAMTSERVYRPALGHEDAIKELTAKSKGHFDPKVVRAFLKVIRGMPGMRRRKLARTGAN